MLEQSTILLAEDDENDILLMQRAFARAHLANPLQVVRDGEEAFSYLKGIGRYADRSKYPLPCMLLLDLKMPKHSGFEVLEWIRQESPISRLIVVILTVSNQTPDINRGYDLGANAYLVKPPDIEGLLTMLRTVQGYWLYLNQFPDVEPKKDERR